MSIWTFGLLASLSRTRIKGVENVFGNKISEWYIVVWKAYTFLGVLDFVFIVNNFWSALHRFNFSKQIRNSLIHSYRKKYILLKVLFSRQMKLNDIKCYNSSVIIG